MRKENIITLTDSGKEKTFKIKQMSASQAERWVFKLALLLGGNANLENINDISSVLNAVDDKPFERVEELLNGLLSCCSRVHDGGITSQLTPENVDGFVDDMTTLMTLQKEAFLINNFFPQSGQSDSDKSPAPAVTIKRAK